MTAAAVANAPDPVVEGAPVDVAAMVAENRRLMAENARLEARCNWPALCAARLFTDPALQEGLQARTGVKTLGAFSSLLSTRRAQFPYGNWIYRGLERIPDEVLESALEAHCKQYIVCTKSTMARTEHTRAHTRPGCALTASRRGAPTSAAPAPCSRRHPPSRR